MSPSTSVGKGPEPTRVKYALQIPRTEPRRENETPVPFEAEAETQFELCFRKDIDNLSFPFITPL